MKNLKVYIITPEGISYEGVDVAIQLPGSLGSFAIKYNHAPLVSELCKGVVKITSNGNSEANFEISSGIMQVVNNEVIVLAESAVKK